MYKIYTLIILGFVATWQVDAQQVIQLDNPSFEDKPHSGGQGGSRISGWSDCGRIYFPNETPPDIHLGMDPTNPIIEPSFGVAKNSSDGFTFLGFVVRDNETYESVTQRLPQPLEGGICYNFSIDLSRSLDYMSPYPKSAISKLYTKPVVLRIYGGSTPCGKRELLAESTPVKNSEWQTYEFTFKPKQTHRYFSISAFYKVPVLVPYNGNLLIDNASDIVQTTCPGEEEILAQVEEPKKETPKKEEPKKVEEEVVVATTTQVTPPIKQDEVKEPVRAKPQMVINSELDRKTLKKGQIIQVNNLYFDADSIKVNPKSLPALEELASFLKFYPEVTIEIGGHTNDRPPRAFCDSLSEARAKSVAEFLYNQDIPMKQVQYKGYGKREPIANNRHAEGRRRNQRVEIKVLDLDS